MSRYCTAVVLVLVFLVGTSADYERRRHDSDEDDGSSRSRDNSARKFAELVADYLETAGELKDFEVENYKASLGRRELHLRHGVLSGFVGLKPRKPRQNGDTFKLDLIVPSIQLKGFAKYIKGGSPERKLRLTVDGVKFRFAFAVQWNGTHVKVLKSQYKSGEKIFVAADDDVEERSNRKEGYKSLAKDIFRMAMSSDVPAAISDALASRDFIVYLQENFKDNSGSEEYD